MSDVEAFIYRYEGHQREVMLYFHNLLAQQMELTDKIRYKIPFYFGKSWICYLNPIKSKSIELAFVRGNELSNDLGLLNNKGRKQIYGVEFEKISQIPTEEIEMVIQEAILLDETKPYGSKRLSRQS